MLMSCVRGHERECTEAVLGFWAIFAAIIGACFVPWRRIFSRDFWTHPTIDEMQAEMLREVQRINDGNLMWLSVLRGTREAARQFGARTGKPFEDFDKCPNHGYLTPQQQREHWEQ